MRMPGYWVFSVLTLNIQCLHHRVSELLSDGLLGCYIWSYNGFVPTYQGTCCLHLQDAWIWLWCAYLWIGILEYALRYWRIGEVLKLNIHQPLRRVLSDSPETVVGIELPFLFVMVSAGAVLRREEMKRRKLRIGKALGSNHVPSLLSFSIPSNPLAVIGWKVLVTCLRATVPPPFHGCSSFQLCLSIRLYVESVLTPQFVKATRNWYQSPVQRTRVLLCSLCPTTVYFMYGRWIAFQFGICCFLPSILQIKTYKRNNLLVLNAASLEIWGVREHGVGIITKEMKWLEYVAVSVIRSNVNVFTKYY